jgi:RNA polymerase sigma-70 factor (ECF subfamily)
MLAARAIGFSVIHADALTAWAVWSGGLACAMWNAFHDRRGPGEGDPAAEVGADPDATLVARLRSGERDAFEEVVRRYSGRMLAVARRFVREPEDARDIVQEAFISAFRNFDSYHGDARLSTWLHRIVVNAALMRIRSRSRRPEESIEALLPKFGEDGHSVQPAHLWVETTHETVEREQRAALVRRTIDELPESYRTVLLMRDIEELDTAETAALLGTTENAVKIRLHRARQALRALLDPHLRRTRA